MATTPLPTDAPAAALLYLERGFMPLPLPPRSKAPEIFDWTNFRTSPSELNGQFDNGNIGLLLGKASNDLVVVDLDTVEAFLAAPFLLPPTKMRGGRNGHPVHWFYRRPNIAGKKFEDPCFAGPATKEHPHGKLMLELLGDGRQCVVCPSVHPSGQIYQWTDFGEPAEIPDAALGTNLLSIRCRQLAAVSLLARYWPSKGSRNDAYLALVGGLLRTGPEIQPIIPNLIRALVAATRDEDGERARLSVIDSTRQKLNPGENVTGWPRLIKLLGANGGQIVKMVQRWISPFDPPENESAIASPKKPLRPLPPYRPFPIEALPQPLQEYARQGALALGCDDAYVAVPCLAAVASAIGNTRVIQLKRGWVEQSIVWAAIIGDSGTLKSPAYQLGIGYLHRIQQRMFEQFKQQAAQFQADLKAYKEAKYNHKEGDPDPGDPPEPPVLKRVICSDITIEMLAVILDNNPRGILAARDELAGWLNSFSRYKGKQGGTDLPNWLEMFRAGTIVVDRKTSERKSIIVPRAAVSVAGGIQPGVLARAMSLDFLESGGMARLLMAMPPKKPKKWSDIEIDPETERAYQSALDKLLELEFEERDGEQRPYVLRLSKEARARWIEFYDDWGREQASAEGELAAALSKLEAYAARFALIHHVLTCHWLQVDDRREVGIPSIEAGITLCRWFADEARRIYAMISETVEERERRRLVEFIRARGGRITVKQLQRSNARKYPTSDSAELALENLVTDDLAHWEDRSARDRGGRPTRECCLNLEKASDETDETSPDDDDGPSEPPGPAPDDTSGTKADGAIFYRENEVSSVSSDVILTPEEQNRAHAGNVSSAGFVGQSQEGFVGRSMVKVMPFDKASQPILITAPADLGMVIAAIENTPVVAVDLETTGLNPRTDRVRLISLATDTVDGNSIAYLIDCFALDPGPILDALKQKDLLFHNAEFDLPFLMRLGFEPAGETRDTIVMSRLLTAGTREGNDLAECVKRELGLTLDKELQRSNWSKSLSADQLRYAANDVLVLSPLYDTLRPKIAMAQLERVLKVEEAALPAIAWMTNKGVPFGRDAWRRQLDQLDADAKRLEREMSELAPRDPGAMFPAWNFDSPDQVVRIFALLGIELKSTDDGVLSGVDHPLAIKLRDYRATRKLLTSYGEKFLAHVQSDGRIYPAWRQTGASSGRMACQRPNMQQIPRGPEYRCCVRASDGKVLVKADYSQIELRIAAKLTGDKNMIDAYARGEDIHTTTARRVLGIQEVTKEHRQLAKALNFGLLYGMGAKGFRNYAKSNFGVILTLNEAMQFRTAFFDAYPGLKRWHRSISNGATDTRTLLGRRQLRVENFTEKLNVPVQGTGADGLKQALGLLWQRRHQCPTAGLVLAVHDEIVVECDANEANAVAAWLNRAMIDAMAPLIDPVPVEVDVKIGQTWGG